MNIRCILRHNYNSHHKEYIKHAEWHKKNNLKESDI